MWPLARHLRGAGFKTEIYGYRTRGYTLEALARQFATWQSEKPNGTIGIVAHSLGALMLLQAMELGLVNPTRAVCLAPPVGGAAIAKPYALLPSVDL